MAKFYVFPSRHLLGQRFSTVLSAFFPEEHHTAWDWPDLAESLAALIEARGDAFVVYKEDLDEGLSIVDALGLYCGATAEDDIIEMRLGTDSLQTIYHRSTGFPAPTTA